MKIENAIAHQRLIEVYLFGEEVFYYGVCIKATGEVWVIINYDNYCFDGYSIFRRENIDYFTVCSESELRLKDNNINDYVMIMPSLKGINTFYSALSLFKKFGLVAYFTEISVDSYYVGKIIDLSAERVVFHLITKEGNWSNEVEELLTDIHYFSCYTLYERNLIEKHTDNSN